MLFLAWLFAAIGAVSAWIIGLADAMSSGPRPDPGAALWGVPLPALAILLAGAHLRKGKPERRSAASSIVAVLPILIAFVTLAVLAQQFL
jgi:hypothetical protein